MARAAEKREARRLRKRVGGTTEIEESGEPDTAAEEQEGTGEDMQDGGDDKV